MTIHQQIFNLENKIIDFSNNLDNVPEIEDGYYLFYTGNIESGNLLYLMSPSYTQTFWAKRENLHNDFKLVESDYESLIRTVKESNFSLYKDFFIVYSIPWLSRGKGEFSLTFKEKMEWIAYETFHIYKPKRVITIDFKTANHVTGVDYFTWEDSIGKKFDLEDYGSELYFLDVSKNISLTKLYYQFKGEDYRYGNRITN